MKKALVAILAVSLILAVFCASSLAVVGDVTRREAKAYTDAAMTNYAGKIPAATALLVRSYDKYADVYLNGKVYYISASDLVHKDLSGDYQATLPAGTRVYQRADSSAKSMKLKKGGTVDLCAVIGEWTLVRTTGSKGLYAFVKADDLTRIRLK